eukprot:GHRR01025428.1.p1 GENE.GHRR01025428.1~~GHRR01025428.1.p1  ORF type:complete len:174 (+),score=16.50 GHRR01025428.1:585-1106(+)
MPIGRYCCDHAPRTARSMAQMTTQHFRSLFDIAHHFQALQGPRGAALRRIFKCTGKNAKCLVGEELSAKYNVKQDNEQFLVSVTNRYTLEQTWFNESRTQKPQTFKQNPAMALCCSNIMNHWSSVNQLCQMFWMLPGYGSRRIIRYTLMQPTHSFFGIVCQKQEQVNIMAMHR